MVSHFDYDTKLADMKTIGRLPSQGTLGLAGAHVVTPGDPYSSVLYYRISTMGQGRMPLIGSRFVTPRNADPRLIKQLPTELSEDKPPVRKPINSEHRMLRPQAGSDGSAVFPR